MNTEVTYDQALNYINAGFKMMVENCAFVNDSGILNASWLDRKVLDRWLYLSSFETLVRINKMYSQFEFDEKVPESIKVTMLGPLSQSHRLLYSFAKNLREKYPGDEEAYKLTKGVILR